MIRFEQVTYSYPSDDMHPVLRDISLILNRGEEIAIMGGNGSGKTTLGLLLCGILKPQSGRIEIHGLPPNQNDNGPVIGFLFQDPDNGLVATTVEREVAFSLENRNTPTDRICPVVNRTLDLFRIADCRERLVWNLSGGEKQRLSLAGLFAAGPNILFLDEPASYLDYEGAGQLEQALTTVKEADPNITIIRVTQFSAVADKYNRAIIIGDGQILADDTPENLFRKRDLLKRTGLQAPLKYLTPRVPVVQTRHKSKLEINEPVLKIENLVFDYNLNNTPYLIDNLMLELRRCEVLALVGPSGCGKSTLAQIICGIYEPLKGNVDLYGSRAVMSFQQPEKQFFLDTAFEEVAFGIREYYYNDHKLAEAVRQSMESADLDFETFKDRDPHSLSGGEARRLGLAVVAALKTDLIIFDEPTCALDEPGLRSFKKLVDESKHAGKAVIIITHNSDIIGDLADRVALLFNGKIDCLTDPMSFFENDEHKEILPMPSVMHYQIMQSGRALTARTDDVFDLNKD